MIFIPQLVLRAPDIFLNNPVLINVDYTDVLAFEGLDLVVFGPCAGLARARQEASVTEEWLTHDFIILALVHSLFNGLLVEIRKSFLVIFPELGKTESVAGVVHVFEQILS